MLLQAPRKFFKEEKQAVAAAQHFTAVSVT
jgi:hypothetical protein